MQKAHSKSKPEDVMKMEFLRRYLDEKEISKPKAQFDYINIFKKHTNGQVINHYNKSCYSKVLYDLLKETFKTREPSERILKRVDRLYKNKLIEKIIKNNPEIIVEFLKNLKVKYEDLYLKILAGNDQNPVKFVKEWLEIINFFNGNERFAFRDDEIKKWLQNEILDDFEVEEEDLFLDFNIDLYDELF